MNTPSEIKSVIEQLMGSPGFKIHWTEHLIHSKWIEWIGKRMALHIRPGKIKDNKLVVMIDDDKWKKPFEEFKGTILDKMERDLGSLTIREFSIVMGNHNKQTPKRRDKDRLPAKPVSKECPELSGDLVKELNLIKDPSVKKALMRLMSKALPFNQKTDH